MQDKKNQNFILLIDCKDEEGLIYKITSILFECNFNIVRNDEYVSQETKHFFMRSEIYGFGDVQEIVTAIKNRLPINAQIKLTPKQKKRIVIFATKEHHCLGELLTRSYFDELNAEIVAVISNYQILKNYTEQYNIQFNYISHENISREEHEQKILVCINKYQPEYIVLAKYMRILSPQFVSAFENKIINIHHSFLPAFIGANPYKQAFNRGVKIIGATAHFVDNTLDEGPIITQSVIPVDHKKSVQEMAMAGRDIEKIVLSNAVRLALEDKIFVQENKTIVFD